MRRRWRRIALPLGAVALSLACPGRTAVLPLSPSDVHTYLFDLKAGWLLHLSFEQQGIDVLVRVLGPDGRELFRVDSPTGDEGSEEVWLVADRPGLYRAVVEASEGDGQGRYRARIAAPRPATAEDRVNATAEKAYHRAFSMEKKAPRAWLEGMYLGAARAWESLGRRGREADARHRLGRIRAEAGNWQGALEEHRQARRLYHLAGAQRSEALSLDRIAEAHQALGELEEARRAGREALPLWQEQGETRNVVATSYRLCQLAHLSGRALEALGCYERILQAWRKRPQEQGMVRVDIGTLYASLGELDRALESYRAAMALLPAGSAARGSALTQIGNAYLRAGASQRALSRFKEAVAISRAARNPGGEASALNGMGLALQRIGRPARALPLFRRALALLDSPSEKATIWCNIGRLYLSLDQSQPAVRAFERALSAGGRAAQADALSGMARATRMQGDWSSAKRRMEQALDLFEALRADVARPPEGSSSMRGRDFLLDLLKATYLASKQDDYEFLIDLLMERHRLEPTRGHDRLALEVSERAQARSLFDSLGAGAGPAIPTASLLDGDTALLEYSVGEERSYLWWVTRTGHASFELPGRAVLETAARKLHGLMARSHRRENETPARRKASEVSRLLLGPVADRLDGKRLLIVAPDVLQYVPFGALPEPSGQGSLPLLDRHEVVRIPSAAVLSRLRKRHGRERPEGLLAMVGDGVFSEEDDRLPAGTSRFSGEGSWMRRLPYVDDEVRSVLGLTGRSEVLKATGFDAVRELVTGGALENFSILHFVTHGLADPKRPERSALLLSRFDRRGRPREGWLRAEEIRELDLTADLVVLSACQTGLGREVRGEGLVGLSQSFLSAGASSVLVSLWNVDDRATAALMERFYRELLKRGLPPAEALRGAQLSLRSEPRWNSPYYWGGFVLLGDWLNKAPAGGSP